MQLNKRVGFVFNNVPVTSDYTWTLYKNDYTGVDLFTILHGGDSVIVTPIATVEGLQEFVSTATEDKWTSVSTVPLSYIKDDSDNFLNVYYKNGFVYINVAKENSDRLFRYEMENPLFFYTPLHTNFSTSVSSHTFRTDVIVRKAVGDSNKITIAQQATAYSRVLATVMYGTSDIGTIEQRNAN